MAAAENEGAWTKPAAMAVPKDGYFKLEQGRYGPVFPRTPANFGFTIVAKIKPGTADAIRGYGKTIEKLLVDDSTALGSLKLHYLRWVLFDIGNETYFMYQGIFDTDFDKYTEDAILLFRKHGIDTVFENLEGFPGGLEDESAGIRQIRARTPTSEFSGIRRISVCHGRRNQKSPAG